MVDPLHAFIRTAADMIAIVDPAGVATYHSPAIEPILGVAPENVVGSPIWELVHPDDVERVQRMVGDALVEGAVQSVRVQARHVDGSWHSLDLAAQLLAGAGPPHVVIHLRDVTLEQRIETALCERDEQLRQAQKIEAIGQLAGGIAHDFSNVLTVIIGASGQLLDELPLDAPMRRHALSIGTTAQRAAAMTKQLLGFSRQQDSAPTILDLNEVLAEVDQLLRPLIGEDIALCINPGRDVWRVRADRTQIEQVLLNLAVNARDAMPCGGRLTIETKNAPAGPDPINGSASSPSVVVRVTDTGAGMDAAVRARAFEPFFTTKGTGKGTGLGLANVDRIVRRSGGWTTLASEVGRGTTVTFSLPRVDEPIRPTPGLPPEGAIHSGAVTQGQTVLLVEDEQDVRELVRDILELAGYSVLEAGLPSAAERIGREFEGTIHLLLTDVVMPEMSGLDLAARLRTYRPNLPVMYMSGYPEPTIGDGGGSAPGAHFLLKPFERQTLLTGVRDALEAVASEGERQAPSA